MNRRWDDPPRGLVEHMNPTRRRTPGDYILLGGWLVVCTLLGTLFVLPLVQSWVAP